MNERADAATSTGRSAPARQRGLAEEWNAQLSLYASVGEDPGPAGRAYRRRVGVVVCAAGLVMVLSVVASWRLVGRVPRLLVGLALVLPLLGLVMMVSGHNPLAGHRRGDSGSSDPLDATRPDQPWQPADLDLRQECPACGATTAWDGTVDPADAPGEGPGVGFTCRCGNRFVATGEPVVRALADALLAAPIHFEDGTDASEHRFRAALGPALLWVAMGDFPAEALYHLKVGEVELRRVDEWPAAWSRP